MAADRSHTGESHCHVTAGAAAVAGTAVAVCAVDRAHEGISGTYNHTQHSKSECARHTTCAADDHASTMQCECVTASSSEITIILTAALVERTTRPVLTVLIAYSRGTTGP